MLRKIATAAFALFALGTAALAQSSPGLVDGQRPTGAQWNSYFAAKQDVLGYTPLNRAGDTMLGRLTLQPATTGGASFNLPVGSAPTSPNNGDIWTTPAGLFFQNNGSTVGPIGQAPFCTSCAFVNVQNEFSALQTINLTSATLPAPVGGAVIRAAQQPGQSSRMEVDAFAGSPTFTGVRYNGTPSALTAITSGNTIMQFIGQGWTGSAVSGGRGAFSCAATENWSSSAQGTKCTILTTTNTTTASVTAMTFDHDGSITTGSPTGGSKGAGTINASGRIYVSGSPVAYTASSPLSIDTNGTISITNPLPVANGGTGSTIQSGAAIAVLPTPTRIGDVLYWTGSIWSSLAGNNSGTNCFTENSSGTPSWASCAGGAVTSFNSRTGAVTPQADDYATSASLSNAWNCTLAASVSSNNLTIALKDNAGNDPSATSPCVISFRSATAATGTVTTRTITAATSITLNSGSSLGTSNSVAFRVWVTAFDTGSTAVLGVSVQSNATSVKPINEDAVASSTACSACSSATSVQTYYTTSAQTSKPLRILGYAEWSSGLSTAGTWASGPTTLQAFGPGTARPGSVLQTQYNTSGSSTTNSNNAAWADAGPSVSLALSSSSNLVEVFGSTNSINSSSASGTVQAVLFRGTVSGTMLGAGCTTGNSATSPIATETCTMLALDKPNTTSAAYQAAIRTNAGTASYGSSQSGLNSIYSTILVKEIQG